MEDLFGVLELLLISRRQGAAGELFGYAPERRILELLTLDNYAPE